MSTPPPDWVIGEPDKDGNYRGPALVPASNPLAVQIAWMSTGQPMLWVDTALYDGGPLTCREAGAGLIRGALLAGGVL